MVDSPSCELLVPVTLSPSILSTSRNGNGCPWASAIPSHWPVKFTGVAGVAGVAAEADDAGAGGTTFFRSSVPLLLPDDQSPVILSPATAALIIPSFSLSESLDSFN